MGTMIDYHMDEIEDFTYQEAVNTRNAVLRKTRQIGQAQNAGECEGLPSDACCDLLATYLNRVNVQYERIRQQAWELYDEMAEFLVDEYCENYEGLALSLDTLLVATQQDSIQEMDADPHLLLAAMDIASGQRGLYLNIFGGDAFGRSKIEEANFTIDDHKKSSTYMDESWDAVIGAMIDEFENEL